MNRHSRSVAITIASLVAIAAAAGAACSPAPDSATRAATSIRPGGEIVASVRSNPTTFNRFTSNGRTDDLVSLLTQAKLVRINRATQETEPWLAESWTRSADGLRYTLKLRPNVTFSDGHPFTSDDVAFSFEAAYDEKTDSPLRGALEVDRKKLQVATPDPHTVVVTFPSAFGPGVRILDNLPIVAAPQARARAQGRDVRQRLGPPDAVGRPGGPGSVRAERVHARPAARVRAQPALLEKRRERHLCRIWIASRS